MFISLVLASILVLGSTEAAKDESPMPWSPGVQVRGVNCVDVANDEEDLEDLLQAAARAYTGHSGAVVSKSSFEIKYSISFC